MRRKIVQSIRVEEGVQCSFENKVLTCKKGDLEISREISIPGTNIETSEGEIRIICEKANKKSWAAIKAYVKHVGNMLKGLEEKFNYELEVCHVHFPMTVKVEGNELIIDNFLGEKFKRKAQILDGVEVKIEGNKISVSGHDLEKTGQTAANIESSARVPKKDRRVFQDGIFITVKKGRHL